MNMPQPIINLIKNKMTQGLTPQAIVEQMTGNNPIINNLINLAEKGNIEEVTKISNNILKEKGINIDLQKELINFKQNFNK